MKSITTSLLAVTALALGGCQQDTLISLKTDPATGQMSRTSYTKYYDAGVWLVPGHLGLSLVVDQLDGENGKLTAYAWNRDTKKRSLKFQSISRGSESVHLDKSELVVVPDDRSGLEVGVFRILNFAKSVDFDVAYELDGAPGKVSLHLERRTPEEMEKYFGKNGRPPYPWYHD